MVRLTVAEKALVEQRWRAGMPSWQIAREMGRAYRTVHDQVDRLRRRPPRRRTRSGRQLCLAEREEISRGLATGDSLRVIATRLGRAPSTVWRGVTRNGGRRRYRGERAETQARVRGRPPEGPKLAV